jgi:hypothetical protein
MMLIHDLKRRNKQQETQTNNMTKNRENRSRGKIRAERTSPTCFRQELESSKHVANVLPAHLWHVSPTPKEPAPWSGYSLSREDTGSMSRSTVEYMIIRHC